MNFDQSYWENRYMHGKTGWDLGYPSPPLKTYYRHFQNKNSSILIPGEGYCNEAAYLNVQGFTDMIALDFSLSALDKITENNPILKKNAPKY